MSRGASPKDWRGSLSEAFQLPDSQVGWTTEMFGSFFRSDPEEIQTKARLIVQQQNIDQQLFKLYWYMCHFPAWKANLPDFEESYNFGLENMSFNKFRAYKDDHGKEAVEIDLISGQFYGINFGVAGHNFGAIYDTYDLYLFINNSPSINIQYYDVAEYYHLPTPIDRKQRIRYTQISVREYHRSHQHQILFDQAGRAIERLQKLRWRQLGKTLNDGHRKRIEGKYDF